MTGQNRFRSGRALAEFGMIVIGVVLAFQVENFREGRELQERGAIQLEALQSDFSESRVRLDLVMEQQSGLLAAQLELIRIIHGQSERPGVDSLRYLVERSRRFHRLEPLTGAYDALVASGDLRLIRGEAIRAEMASFIRAVSDGYEDEELSLLLRAELVDAAVSSSEYLSLLEPQRRAQFGFPESSRSPDFDALLSNDRFMSYLTLVHILEAAQQGYLGRLSTSLDRILCLLGATEPGAVC